APSRCGRGQMRTRRPRVPHPGQGVKPLLARTRNRTGFAPAPLSADARLPRNLLHERDPLVLLRLRPHEGLRSFARHTAAADDLDEGAYVFVSTTHVRLFVWKLQHEPET